MKMCTLQKLTLACRRGEGNKRNDAAVKKAEALAYANGIKAIAYKVDSRSLRVLDARRGDQLRIANCSI